MHYFTLSIIVKTAVAQKQDDEEEPLQETDAAIKTDIKRPLTAIVTICFIDRKKKSNRAIISPNYRSTGSLHHSIRDAGSCRLNNDVAFSS